MLSNLLMAKEPYLLYRKKDNQAIVSIKGTGRGIDAEMLPKLFSKFAPKSFAGTGLGLYFQRYSRGPRRQNLGS